MSVLITILGIIVWALISLLSIWVGYLVLLTILAWTASRKINSTQTDPRHQFAIMIPAHNEERLLPDLLENLSELEYPNELYTVNVVADNCSDETAALARQAGAAAFERFDDVNMGKGCALQWLFGQIEESKVPFDAAVILDADSIVSANFLSVMDAKLSQGETAIQAYYAVRDAEQSWATSLRAAALAVLHYLRPQGRMVLGVSAGLKGNGMVFHRSVLAEHEWSASITEDIEYHMSLVLNGKRVAFAPDAIVWAEIPTGLSDSNTQNERWEQGRLEMAKVYVPQLLGQAFSLKGPANNSSRMVLLDAAMEHLIPPFSVVLGLNLVVCLLAAVPALLGNAYGSLQMALLLFFGQVFYLISGMILARIPAKAYLAMLYLPSFLCWKIWLYIRMFVKPNEQEWVRTRRIGEQQ